MKQQLIMGGFWDGEEAKVQASYSTDNLVTQKIAEAAQCLQQAQERIADLNQGVRLLVHVMSTTKDAATKDTVTAWLLDYFKDTPLQLAAINQIHQDAEQVATHAF